MSDKFPNMPLQCTTCVFEKFFEISLQKLPYKKKYVLRGNLSKRNLFSNQSNSPNFPTPLFRKNHFGFADTIYFQDRSLVEKWKYL